MIKESLAPEWQETFELGVVEAGEARSTVTFKVWDADHVGRPDFLGEATLITLITLIALITLTTLITLIGFASHGRRVAPYS